MTPRTTVESSRRVLFWLAAETARKCARCWFIFGGHETLVLTRKFYGARAKLIRVPRKQHSGQIYRLKIWNHRTISILKVFQ
ncbi:hypothetical protein BV898_07549 [Hypsibius exemplaris]|uniref:Uncharacterized protein n=1 Tax=Hypsibius exemplaris TaxID=2072580 RepID=A0A1W0WT23_HYPEX|nr:hypothetical protein BV898_07549 [Hypsibius exemplaris]